MPEITREEVTDWKLAVLSGFRKGVANETIDLEGAIVTPRHLSSYETDLGINLELLSGERVLNFGSGNSDIGKDLKDKGVDCQVVDLDLVAGGEDRNNLVQGDGRALPFPDQSFDHVLGLWSTYQIPSQANERVYKELMRVGKIIHAAPVFKDDFRILQGLAQEEGYDIVGCKPMPKPGSVKKPFSFTTVDDYGEYMRNNEESARIESPKRENPRIAVGLRRMQVSSKGGSSMVLMKKEVSR